MIPPCRAGWVRPTFAIAGAALLLSTVASAEGPTAAPPPTIDVHAHVFNFHALPNRGILRSKGVGPLAAKIVAKWIEKNTQSSPLDRDDDKDAVDPPEATMAPLTEGERQDILDFLRSRSKSFGAPGEKVSLSDEELVAAVLAEVGFDDHPAASGPAALPSLRGYGKFLKTLRGTELGIVADLRREFPDVRFFAHHMMDMSSAYANVAPVIPFDRQVARMGELTRRSDGVLGTFVAFDPFRRDGLDIVKDAWARGALGVKVYPPSGYRAAGNVIPREPLPGFQRKRWKAAYGQFDGDPGELDARMDGLFVWAVSVGAPILTHCTPKGAEADRDYGYNSDPKYWKTALGKHPHLRIDFGHAGGGGGWGVEESEWSGDHPKQAEYKRLIVDLCTQYPNAYCSLDYIDEVLNPQGRTVLVRRIGEAMRRTGPGGDFSSKLMYGTDWHMISKLENPASYLKEFRNVFNDPSLVGWREEFFGCNAARFLDLEGWLERIEPLGAASPLDAAGRANVERLLSDLASCGDESKRDEVRGGRAD